MAGDQFSVRPVVAFRWWFLLSWLGLDAPCVVLTWTWATSRAAGLPLPWTAAAGLFFVVWFIYLTDRLVDVARCRDWSQPTGRLRFGRDHRWLFVACLASSIAGMAIVLILRLPAAVVWRAAVVAVGMLIYALAFVAPIVLGEKLPGKELFVGIFFALGAFACLGLALAALPLFVSIALVVGYNCLVIAARDAQSDRANDPGGASRWWPSMQRDLLWVGVALTVVAGAATLLAHEKAFYFALAASFALLVLLHRCAPRFSADAVRALADFALFTPLPVILAA